MFLPFGLRLVAGGEATLFSSFNPLHYNYNFYLDQHPKEKSERFYTNYSPEDAGERVNVSCHFSRRIFGCRHR